jgi:hypothetical protein
MPAETLSRPSTSFQSLAESSLNDLRRKMEAENLYRAGR